MNTETMLMMYLADCEQRARLDWKTVKAYRCDLRQFCLFLNGRPLCRSLLEDYLTHLHAHYAPRSVRRKLASLHAFFSYLVFHERIEENPLDKIRTHFQKPLPLPRTISPARLQHFFRYLYRQADLADTPVRQMSALCNVALFELLFSTGVRISELCQLRIGDVDLLAHTLRIRGKGKKERLLSIGSPCARRALKAYHRVAHGHAQTQDFFFRNRNGRAISDQSVRLLLQNYCRTCDDHPHITPHMFRHTFASMLLEDDVDIRCIQHILGHSSITTTQIYTHVSDAKQKEILQTKNPRDRLTRSCRAAEIIDC